MVSWLSRSSKSDEASSLLWPEYTARTSDSRQQHLLPSQANNIYSPQATCSSQQLGGPDHHEPISAPYSLGNQEVSAAIHLDHLSEQHDTECLPPHLCATTPLAVSVQTLFLSSADGALEGASVVPQPTNYPITPLHNRHGPMGYGRER